MHAPAWEHLEHQADIGVRGYGRTVEEAFEQAALALIAVITPPDKVRPVEAVALRCQAPDLEVLLVDWLSAILCAMSERGVLFGRFAVQIRGETLEGTAWGEPVDRARHQPVVEVKAATYAGLKVQRQADGTWTAQCIVDV